MKTDLKKFSGFKVADELNYYRVALAGASFSIPLLSLALQNEGIEFFYDRLAVALLGFVVLGLSFVSRRVQKNIARIVSFVFLVMLVEVGIMTGVNRLNIAYLMAMQFTLFVSGIFLGDKKWFLWIVVLNMLAALATAWVLYGLDINVFGLLLMVSGSPVLYLLGAISIDTRNQLVESRESLHQIFEESTDALIMVDVEERRMVDCNQLTLETFGVDNKGEFLSKKLGWFVYSEKFNIDGLIAAVSSGNQWHLEAQCRRADERLFWADIAAKEISLLGRKTVLIRMADVTDKIETTLQAKKLNKFMVGREVQMTRLKEKVKQLEGELAGVGAKKQTGEEQMG